MISKQLVFHKISAFDAQLDVAMPTPDSVGLEILAIHCESKVRARFLLCHLGSAMRGKGAEESKKEKGKSKKGESEEFRSG